MFGSKRFTLIKLVMLTLLLSACGGGNSGFDAVDVSTLDSDGDSYTPAGGDCNDGDALINPLATDIPNNTIDEDCSGADAVDHFAVCETLQEEEVRIAVDGLSVTASNTDYKLYLEDFFNALQVTDGEVLTGEEQNILNAIVSKINDYMRYQIFENYVVGSNNPLDFIEELISSSSTTGQLQVAKEMLVEYIQNRGDSFCSYRNRDIIISDLEGNNLLALELRLSFDPFNEYFSQSLIMSEMLSNLGNAQTNVAVSYTSFFGADPEVFADVSYSLPKVRFASINNDTLSENLVISEGYDTKLGYVELNFINTYCDQDAEGSDISDYIACTEGIVTRAVQKEQCDGSSNGETDEVNKLAVHSFDLNASNTDIKRLRVETDYASGDVRIYSSLYNEAIYDSDSTTVIMDPTKCEKQAVLDELFEANPDVGGVRLTSVPDHNYDIQYVLDENGALIQDQNGKDVIVEPIPMIQFLGTLIPSRK
jgi:hypothetical protein